MQQPSTKGGTANLKVIFPEQSRAPEQFPEQPKAGVTADVSLFIPDDYLVGYHDGRRDQLMAFDRVLEQELSRVRTKIRTDTFIGDMDAGAVLGEGATKEYREGYGNGLGSGRRRCEDMVLWELDCLRKRFEWWL